MLFEILLLAALAHTPCIDRCLEVRSGDVVNVYDGDTITIKIDSWPPMFRIMSFRLKGFDTPEIRGKCVAEKRLAHKARKELKRIIRMGDVVRLDELEKGKYFRLVAVLSVDGMDVGDHMISKGLAREYSGGKRESWCENGEDRVSL